MRSMEDTPGQEIVDSEMPILVPTTFEGWRPPGTDHLQGSKRKPDSQTTLCNQLHQLALNELNPEQHLLLAVGRTP